MINKHLTIIIPDNFNSKYIPPKYCYNCNKIIVRELSNYIYCQDCLITPKQQNNSYNINFIKKKKKKCIIL